MAGVGRRSRGHQLRVMQEDQVGCAVATSSGSDSPERGHLAVTVPVRPRSRLDTDEPPATTGACRQPYGGQCHCRSTSVGHPGRPVLRRAISNSTPPGSRKLPGRDVAGWPWTLRITAVPAARPRDVHGSDPRSRCRSCGQQRRDERTRCPPARSAGIWRRLILASSGWWTTVTTRTRMAPEEPARPCAACDCSKNAGCKGAPRGPRTPSGVRQPPSAQHAEVGIDAAVALPILRPGPMPQHPVACAPTEGFAGLRIVGERQYLLGECAS